MLSRLIDTYTFRPFESMEMEEFVRKEWETNREKHDILYLRVSLDASHKKVNESLFYRYPVYFGKPMRGYYSQSKLETLMNITKIPKVDPSVRYILGGQVSLRDGSRKGKDTYVFHTWGINLESHLTEDYKTFVDRRGRLKRDAYENLTADIVASLFYATEKVRVERKWTVAHLVLPQLGLGAFLTGLKSKEDKDWAIQNFLNILIETSKELPHIHTHYCIFNADRKRVIGFGSNLKVYCKGDMFQVLKGLQKVDLLIGVNAWDSKSWVGNGMARDPTIDGFMVAGTGPGRAWQNSSFLHNPLLHMG